MPAGVSSGQLDEANATESTGNERTRSHLILAIEFNTVNERLGTGGRVVVVRRPDQVVRSGRLDVAGRI